MVTATTEELAHKQKKNYKHSTGCWPVKSMCGYEWWVLGMWCQVHAQLGRERSEVAGWLWCCSTTAAQKRHWFASKACGFSCQS